MLNDLHGVVRRTIERSRAGEGTIRRPGPTSIQLQVENMWLNIWEPVCEPITCMPHTHQRGFTSTVLLGRLITERLEIHKDDAGEYAFYRIVKSDDGRRMEYIPANWRCSVTSTTTEQPAGTIYHCPPDVFHRVTQPELTMTFLQLWGEPEREQYGLLPWGYNVGVIERYASKDTLPQLWAKVEEVCKLAGF